MIEAMRSKAASWIAKILALFLILSFAVWGVGDMVPGQGVTQTVATLDDVIIDKDLVVTKLQSSVNVMRAALGPQFDNRQAVELGFLDRALDEIIDETLLSKEINNLELEVGENTIRQAIYDDPRFRGIGGSIDRQAFQGYLRQEGISESQFISILKNRIKKNQLLSAFTSGIEAPDILVEKLIEYSGEKRIAAVLTIPYRGTGSLETPNSEILQKFYHENKELFRTPEYRDITSIYLDPEEFGKSVTPPVEKVQESFEALKASASVPERRDLSQILVLSDRDLEKIKSDLKKGKPFEQISKDVIGKPPLALGKLSKREMVPVIAEAAFKLQPKEITKPIKTALGWHIVKLNKIEPGRMATLKELRPRIIKELKREIATDEIIQITERIDDKLAEGLPLEDAAKNIGINIKKFKFIDSMGNSSRGVPVTNFPKAPRFLDVTRQLDPGENSTIEETNDGSYFVLRVDKIHKSKIPKIDDVQQKVIFAWKQKQVQKIASNEAKDLITLAKARGLNQIAKERNLKIFMTQPFSRSGQNPETKISDQLSSAIFNAKENEFVFGPNIEGFSIAKLVKIIRVVPDRKSKNFTESKDKIRQAITEDLIRQLITELKKNSNLTINRQVLQRIRDEQLGG